MHYQNVSGGKKENSVEHKYKPNFVLEMAFVTLSIWQNKTKNKFLLSIMPFSDWKDLGQELK